MCDSKDIITSKDNVKGFIAGNPVKSPEEMARCPRYKAYFKRVTLVDKQEFKVSNAMLTISVGQPNHEGTKFEATLKLVNKNFSRCVFLVADSLQRYTISILKQNHNLESLRHIANIEGNRWIERTHALCDKVLTIPYEVSRWDYWLQHKDFRRYYEKVCFLYNNDAEYKCVVENTIEMYLSRLQKRGQSRNSRWERELSLNYMLEESAVVNLLIDMKCQFEIYPSLRNEAVTVAYNKIMGPAYKSLLRPISLEIKKFDNFVEGK